MNIDINRAPGAILGFGSDVHEIKNANTNMVIGYISESNIFVPRPAAISDIAEAIEQYKQSKQFKTY